MCGLNGIFAYRPSAESPLSAELLTTRDYMRARGPDGAGEWWTDDRRLGLGHRRLSILDLTEFASQPMTSACERFVVVFNGEIYNYPELRDELRRRGVKFRTTSDTEILLHLYALKGEAMVHDLRGMFALALWDKRAETLFLARDPFGIKPLYVADDGGTFRFASQVKALLAGGNISREPEPAGIVGFHLWGSVPEPFTLYRQIRALPAGHSQIVRKSGAEPPTHYCSIPETIAESEDRSDHGRDVGTAVAAAARDSVSAHLLADVEVGVFLSAGIDSGAVLGLMRDAGQQKIRALTLNFEEFRGTSEDETEQARDVARLYGAEHIVRTVSEAEYRSDLPAILEAMDQPSIDGINSWFVAKAAREAGLKVALSGVGGDEMLAGYSSFHEIPKMVSWLRMPAAIPGLETLLRGVIRAAGLARRKPKAIGLLPYGGSIAGAYLLRRSLFLPLELNGILDPDMLRAGLLELAPVHRLQAMVDTMSARAPIAQIAGLEISNYLQAQLLRDTDWASMAHSVEVRTPLVDIDLLRSLAPHMSSMTDIAGKRALASAPSTPLPNHIVMRPKTGFSIPAGRWLRSAGSSPVSRNGMTSRIWAQTVLDQLLAPA